MPGSGAYADSEVGAAAATGLDNSKITFYACMITFHYSVNDDIKTCWNQHNTGIVHCTLNSQSMAKLRTLLKPDEAEHYATLAWSG